MRRHRLTPFFLRVRVENQGVEQRAWSLFRDGTVELVFQVWSFLTAGHGQHK
jgi:hypothetical protein